MTRALEHSGVIAITAVYLVDDEEIVRTSVSALLTTAGLSCRAYASSNEFLDDAQPNLRGCLVVDFRMPEMDGLELYRELRTRGFTLPVVFLTAHADVPLAVAAMREGAADFIEKPFKNEDLLNRIQTALGQDKNQGAVFRKLERLSPRESEVAQLMAEGLSTKAIAAEAWFQCPHSAESAYKHLQKDECAIGG